MHLRRPIPNSVSASLSLGLLGALTLAACGGGGGATSSASTSSSQMASQTSTGFADTALVSNGVGVVATTTTIDANLSNPWGVALAPGLPF